MNHILGGIFFSHLHIKTTLQRKKNNDFSIFRAQCSSSITILASTAGVVAEGASPQQSESSGNMILVQAHQVCYVKPHDLKICVHNLYLQVRFIRVAEI